MTAGLRSGQHGNMGADQNMELNRHRVIAYRRGVEEVHHDQDFGDRRSPIDRRGPAAGQGMDEAYSDRTGPPRIHPSAWAQVLQIAPHGPLTSERREELSSSQSLRR
jgi:hypothetical protein